MYTYHNIQDQITGADQAITKPVERYGVQVYVDSVTDIVDSDFYIDPADTKGLEIFRNFCRQMAEHYKHLK